MNHALILPILLPMFVGSLLLCGAHLRLKFKRLLSLVSAGLLVPLSLWLLLQADQGMLQSYALGNWQAPFGIVLLLDRLSALMLVVTAVLGFFALAYAVRGDDERGHNFHALFQFQLMGINGAFLTGDLFNLFVFFEILLIASYSLLVHGGGAQRVRAGLHYVVLNLVGSAFFLIAVGVLYGITGTLNMADMAQRVAAANADQAPLLGAAGLLLLVVFGLKAAVLPLYFWLPRAYAASTAPVAALFAIMTKVGLYSIIRVYTLIFGDEAGSLANMVQDWLWPLALLTLGLGVIGALAAVTLQGLVAYLMVVSVGTLLAGVAIGTPQALAAALFYLVHSTWVAGGLFLLADLISRQRGEKRGDLVQGPALQNPHVLGALFFLGAIAVAGLPPMSGFIGKLLLLRALEPGVQALFLWPVVLVGGLGILIALSRAGSTLFWRVGRDQLDSAELDRGRLLACIGLLLLSPLLVVFAAPIIEFVDAAALQVHDLAQYRQTLGGGAQ
ncbi:MAG: monovalent cation/H+ antiporter subunit D [Gammaproteobacteria bacterium]|nr:monovalent cation/H+ antiporter subunit D [Gammaproteobacteria bacterium]MBU1488642.1 monovalent cation/H+ antiporter subunit D [Gammaproteobacteria bacterium]MBU2064767.1 monovalent cation/H+ antiporter subunit D [Gammaproteobacteria bacterium]MBU2139439.1 monovalent cation/H+ antiporter subunit D [Gammaproteobacteria bacterium]MBU2218219.1 monovalent cation/H+ antiporter subunit D [Gammaproteobacteria bacterium]